MSALVPNRLMFHFEMPLRYRESPTIDGDLSDWSASHVLPDLTDLDNAKSFATFYAGWNETGLFVACAVTGRKTPFQCDAKQFWKGDNLRVMTDMRDTRDNRRASRYCQHFFFMPAGGLDDVALGGGHKIQRATEQAPIARMGTLPTASQRKDKSYTIEAHIPAEALAGFDPNEHKRIGLYVMLEDTELGQQYLTVGDDLNWYVDPSTWVTAELKK